MTPRAASTQLEPAAGTPDPAAPAAHPSLYNQMVTHDRHGRAGASERSRPSVSWPTSWRWRACPQHRAALERLVRAQTGLDVRFNELGLRLGWYGPEAVFRRVELGEPGASNVLLRAPAAHRRLRRVANAPDGQARSRAHHAGRAGYRPRTPHPFAIRRWSAAAAVGTRPGAQGQDPSAMAWWTYRAAGRHHAAAGSQRIGQCALRADSPSDDQTIGRSLERVRTGVPARTSRWHCTSHGGAAKATLKRRSTWTGACASMARGCCSAVGTTCSRTRRHCRANVPRQWRRRLHVARALRQGSDRTRGRRGARRRRFARCAAVARGRSRRTCAGPWTEARVSRRQLARGAT